jgi:hypothetical protein
MRRWYAVGPPFRSLRLCCTLVDDEKGEVVKGGTAFDVFYARPPQSLPLIVCVQPRNESVNLLFVVEVAILAHPRPPNNSNYYLSVRSCNIDKVCMYVLYGNLYAFRQRVTDKT